MKVVLLAGGYGTRISEETDLKPKPMVEIGSMPIIWHIMKYYSTFGIRNFIICCGYKGNIIKRFFLDYSFNNSDITCGLHLNDVKIHKKNIEDWNVTLVDTGNDTMTGGRLKRVKKYLINDDFFCLTYGDGLSDINITKSISLFKKNRNAIGCISSVNLKNRFGSLKKNSKNLILSFAEKPVTDNLINAGFAIFSKKIFSFIKNDNSILEKHVLSKIAQKKRLITYLHKGFFYPMDTLRDKIFLTNLWNKQKAPWKKW